MKEVKKRILWVDITKALAILSVPISHTLEVEWMIRTMIFSFHMPLFFILSGFTTKLATDWQTFRKRLKKNLLYLIVPTILVLVIYAISSSFLDNMSHFGDKGFSAILPNLKEVFQRFFIDRYPDGVGNASAVWFLVALFTAKTIMDIVNIIFKSEKNWLIFFLFGILGMCLGIFSHRPPFYLDLALVATMFIEIGLLWRKHEKTIKKYTVPLLIVSIIFWFNSVMNGVFLELWLRFYAGYGQSILVAVAGTFMVSNFAMMLEESVKKSSKIFKKAISALVLVGKNLLLFLLVHCIDDSVFYHLWEFRDGSKKSILFSVLIRFILDILVFVLVYCLLNFWKKRHLSHAVSK